MGLKHLGTKIETCYIRDSPCSKIINFQPRDLIPGPPRAALHLHPTPTTLFVPNLTLMHVISITKLE